MLECNVRSILMGLAIPWLVACNPKAQPAGQEPAGPGDAGAATPTATPASAPEPESTPGAGGRSEEPRAGADLRAVAHRYPLPVPDGARGTSHDRWVDGRRSHDLRFTHPCSADELAADYEAAMKDRGLDVKTQRTVGNGKTFRSLNGTTADVKASAIVGTRHDLPGDCDVSLHWSETAVDDVATAVASTTATRDDFPLPVPEGVKGDVTDHADSGGRQRSVMFRDDRSHEDLTALYEKVMKQLGLEPETGRVSDARRQVTSLTAKREGILAQVNISTPKSGPSELFVSWQVTAK